MYEIKHNPNDDDYRAITRAIEDNDGYCCCELEHTPDTKCPCKKFREAPSSACDCGRFYKVTNYPIITLCGSTRFKEEFLKKAKELTLAGWIVLSVGVFGHFGDIEADKPEIKAQLDDIHKQKIAMSDAIYVINKSGYIGKSTQAEIEWAKFLNKDIIYMEETGE